MDLSARNSYVQAKMRWFEYDHLTGLKREVSKLHADLAYALLELLDDGPQLTLGLQHLIDAKDCHVRQAVLKEESTE